MKALGLCEAMEAMAKALGKPILYISIDVDDLEEVVKAAPYLEEDELTSTRLSGGGFIVCDNLDELNRLYDLTVGDDGPTASNPYNGATRVYALTSEGNENT